MAGGLDAVGLDLDDVAIDRDAEVPIGVQLAWALRSRISGDDLEPGHRLPGLREVAEMVGVNVNTVRAVYQQLEREGLIDSQQGSGTFVASAPGRGSTVATIAADAARAANATGVEPREVAAALYVSPRPRIRTTRDASERRRALREQIASLERTLVEMEAKHPGVTPASAEIRDLGGPALLDAEELELVQTMLVRRLAVVQAAIDQLGQPETEEVAAEEEPQVAPKRSHSARARPQVRPASAGA
jgi:DNA-binding transcriptional regulator YhcF (GntR family)